MSTQPTNAVQPPLRFQSDFQKVEENESDIVASLLESLTKITDTTEKDEGQTLRAVHAKSHGFLKGELTVFDNLPEELAQGIFSTPSTYPVVMRFSTVPGDLLDDSVSLPRGVAVKVVGVEGARLPGSEGDTTQDFVMINAPAFSAPDAGHFQKNLKMLAMTTDKAQPLKKALSTILRGTEKIVEVMGGKSSTLISMGGHPETHILGETFYTAVPCLYGAYVAKLALVPVSPELVALTNASLNVNGKPNGLREAILDHFLSYGGEWELRAQLLTDRETMPIEDASVQWPENASPYRTVARLRVTPQTSWSEARAAVVDKQFSFSPWHGVAAHRPLGSIMRVRQRIYEVMSKRRGVGAEPKTLAGIPD